MADNKRMIVLDRSFIGSLLQNEATYKLKLKDASDENVTITNQVKIVTSIEPISFENYSDNRLKDAITNINKSEIRIIVEGTDTLASWSIEATCVNCQEDWGGNSTKIIASGSFNL